MNTKKCEEIQHASIDFSVVTHSAFQENMQYVTRSEI